MVHISDDNITVKYKVIVWVCKMNKAWKLILWNVGYLFNLSHPAPARFDSWSLIVGVGHVRIQTSARLSQKCLIWSTFSIFGAPQVPGDDLSPAEQVLSGRKASLIPGTRQLAQ